MFTCACCQVNTILRTWLAAMQICSNKRNCFNAHTKKYSCQLPQDWSGTTTWGGQFHRFGILKYLLWRHVKKLFYEIHIELHYKRFKTPCCVEKRLLSIFLLVVHCIFIIWAHFFKITQKKLLAKTEQLCHFYLTYQVIFIVGFQSGSPLERTKFNCSGEFSKCLHCLSKGSHRLSPRYTVGSRTFNLTNEISTALELWFSLC